ncbi:SRPBCC family protein, partial [Candidatus Bathyarchaeota archaeon]
MTRIVQQFEVAAPPEKVFATISVPEKWPRWSTFVKQATSHGSTAHWIYDLGGMKVQSD